MSNLISECQSLKFEMDFVALKEEEEIDRPKMMIGKMIHGIYTEIYTKEYVRWLEERRDYWIGEVVGLKQRIEELEQKAGLNVDFED